MRDLSLNLIQADTHWHDPAANREMYAQLARAAPAADLIVLPETCLSGFSNEALHQAEAMDGPNTRWLADLAAALNCTITGSFLVREAHQVFNRLIWMPPNGAYRYYDKRHLFRMAKEHERYGAGTTRLLVEINGWRVCPLVCYDLRFPVFSRNRFSGAEASSRDYDLLVYVANWPATRRFAWQSLLRARAIENLSYCVGVNRVGVDGNALEYAGDSVALDFTGQSLAECAQQPNTLHVRLSASKLAEYRRQFPAYLDADQFQLF
ncbi:amidohydrolase [bacterium]|nr:amidohydrolase [bacterium]